MRIDLFLRLRRDRFNLAIRLRLLAGAAAVASVIVMVVEVDPAEPLDLRHLPLILIMPSQPLPTLLP